MIRKCLYFVVFVVLTFRYFKKSKCLHIETTKDLCINVNTTNMTKSGLGNLGCDQNYRSNAQPRLRLADLLTEVVILKLCRGSEG